MNTNYEIFVSIRKPDGNRVDAAYQVPAFLAKEYNWPPYDLCSDVTTAILFGGITATGASRIDADREKLAEEVSGKITKHILDALKSEDLKNGYTQEELKS